MCAPISNGSWMPSLGEHDRNLSAVTGSSSALPAAGVQVWLFGDGDRIHAVFSRAGKFFVW